VIETLFEIYLPLIGWTLAGLLLLRSVPASVPKLMGRSLYWVGVPLQVFAFMLRSDLTKAIWLVPAVVAGTLLIGFCLSWIFCWRFDKQERGSFLLSAIIGNTGFVGLAIAPYLLTDEYLGWAVLFSVANNVMGSYGLGVVIASYYGDRETQVSWLTHLKSVLKTPVLWSFGIGLWLQYQHIELAQPLSDGLQLVAKVVAPVALLLVGIRLKQTYCLSAFNRALPAVLIKLILLPLAVGLSMVAIGIPEIPRLAMVLQAGMPTGLACIIVAEEYNLSDDAIVMSIALSSVGVLATIPLWLWLF
jgi:malate permease and related proteins